MIATGSQSSRFRIECAKSMFQDETSEKNRSAVSSYAGVYWGGDPKDMGSASAADKRRLGWQEGCSCPPLQRLLSFGEFQFEFFGIRKAAPGLQQLCESFMDLLKLAVRDWIGRGGGAGF